MELKVYQTSGDFLKEQKAYLLKREAVSQLLLYNAMNCSKDEEKIDTNIFGKIEHNNEVQILFCNVLPFNLLIYTEQEAVDEEVLQSLVQYLVHNQVIINGINARYDICRTFLKLYKIMTNYKWKQYLAMDIMELRNLTEVDLARGYTRLATLQDANLIAKWKSEFALEALNEVIEPELMMERIHNQIESQLYYLFINENNEIVSMASPSRKLIQGVCINAVYTPRCFRNQKYAMTNMYYLCMEMLERGNEFITLFVDKTNPISNRVYQKIGFHILEDCYDYRIVCD